MRSYWARLCVCLSIPLLALAVLATSAISATQSVPLRFYGLTFDPLEHSAEKLLPPTLPQTDQRTGEKQLYIVQFNGPIAQKHKTALRNLGAQLVDYIPDFAFSAYMDGAAANRAAELDGVRWVGIYQAGLRIEPGLRRAIGESRTAKRVDLIVVVPISAEMPAIRSAINALGGDILDQTARKFRIQINADHIATLASLPAVSWIEAAPSWQLFNGPAAGVLGVTQTRSALNLHGAGQIIAVADTGLDQGSPDPASLHDDFEDGVGASRVITLIDRVGDGANDANSGHGTHVAASALGNGVRSGAAPISSFYPLTAHAGIAPHAQLVFQAIEDNTTKALAGIPNDLNILFAEAYAAGARIHNNSWGSSLDGAYTSFSQDIDEFLWHNPDMVIVFAAGNDGTDGDSDGVIDRTSMGNPGTAKNALTVGASENNRPGWCCWQGTAPIGGSLVADNVNGLTPFSSRGYTLDWRIKPDVVAPGAMILSARSADCLPTCVGWGAVDDNYMYYGGTSMAAPLVSGSAALVREYYQQVGITAPSAALIKATLINGSAEMFPGQYGLGAIQEISQTRPSPHAGWGRVDLANTLSPAAPRQMWSWDIANGLSTGESIQYTFEITQSQALSASLVWSDYPGTPAAAGGLVNDLDLHIEAPDGTVHYPNHAMQAGTAQHISYLNGTSPEACSTTDAGAQRAVRFTPTAYPAALELAQFFVGSDTNTFPKTFTYALYDDDGVAGLPGTLLGSGSTSLMESGWHPVDLTGHNLTLTAGDIYIAFTIPDTDFLYCGDTEEIDGRGYAYADSTWLVSTSDYAIKALFSGVAPSSNYDRVNNVVGIDLATPVTGVYTATITGYNVPQGPQPYAFVVSGIGRLVGIEAITLTVDGPGTYLFANTGVSMTFSSEDIDSVVVTVARDTQPPAGANLINRYYDLHAVGGSGSFSADIAFTYEQSEYANSPAASQPESALQLLRYSDGSWGNPALVQTIDTEANVITIEGVTGFSGWSLATFAPTATRLHAATAHSGPALVQVTLIFGLAIIGTGIVVWRRKPVT